MGFGLNRAFERSVLAAAEDALRNQVMLLISGIEVVDGKVVPPLALTEPRLMQADSDLYAQIRAFPSANTVLWRSPSLLERELPNAESGLGNFEFSPSLAWQQDSINLTTLAVEWETPEGAVPFIVQVGESDASYKRRLVRYQRQVGVWLLFFGGALIVLLLGMLGWALKPLERVRKQVGEIEVGERTRFDEDYPMEVSRLTQNLNQLLNFEEKRIERHREVLGNLAHSLKTPIAVLKGLQYRPEVKSEADEQLSSMQTIIDYQLQSASAVGRRRFSQAVDIQESSEQIVRSLEKLHVSKGLSVDLSISPGTVFFGDKGDWMEVLGNLCDNAFKWSSSKVSIEIKPLETTQSQSNKSSIEIIVQDDGPGIDEALKTSISQRGVRLDTQTPGHGLGMHIVKGVVDAYDGVLTVTHSEFDSGTKFVVVLN